MNVIGHGIDIINIEFFKELAVPMGEYFEWRYLTATECHDLRFRTNRIQYLASRLAAKTAVFKAMGGEPIHPNLWQEIEIQRLPTGEPSVVLYARCRDMAVAVGVAKWLLSISHTLSYAAASAISLKA